jgi:transposase
VVLGAPIDRGSVEGKWLGWRLRKLTCELFEHWTNYRYGKSSRAALLRRMGPVRRKVERLLLRGTQSGNKELRGTCRELYEHRQWLWTFLRQEGVEPTNNVGERSLRHARAPRAAWSVAEALVRHAKCQWEPIRRDHADGH